MDDRRVHHDRVMHEHTAFESLQSGSYLAADSAESDHSHCQVTQGSHLVERSGQSPFARMNQIAVRYHLPRGCQDECQGVIGHFVNAVVRNITYRNTACTGRRQIHIIHSDAIAHDHFRLTHIRDDTGVDACKLCDHRIGIAN